MSEVPQGPSDNSDPENSMPNGVQDSPETLLERLKNLDYSNPRTVAVCIGSAAAALLALGAGTYYVLRKGDHPIAITHGDRHMKKQGIISIVQIVERGTAISAPITEEALSALEKIGDDTKTIFAMDGEGTAYLLTHNPEHVKKYTVTAKKVAGWLISRFSSSESEVSQTDPNE